LSRKVEIPKETESTGDLRGFGLTDELNWQEGSAKIETTGPKARYGKVQILKVMDIRTPDDLGAALVLILVMSTLNLAKPSVGRRFSKREV